MNPDIATGQFHGPGAPSGRTALAACLTAALAGPFSIGAFAAVQSPAPARPNIVFILADDIGYGELGCYGETRYATPNIDALAREGIRFADFYGAPECTPSRCSLMTGLDSGHARLRANFAVNARGERIRPYLLPQDVTIAEVLHKAGYATACIGKWGLGDAGSTGVPWKQGFDYFYGFLDDAHAHNYYPEFVYRNAEMVPLPKNFGAHGEYIHDDFTREALAFIDRRKSGPFFLYLPYTIPHAEFLAPDDALLHVPLNLSDGWPADKVWPSSVYFAAMMRRIDRDVGRIMARLRELGLDRNTLVIFASDNGGASAGHGRADSIDVRFFKANGPLRGFKSDVYEGGIRVPFIARWPGRIAPGRVDRVPLAMWDVLPTLAAVAGASAPPRLDGISFLPDLLGQPQPPHAHLYWEFLKDGQPRFAVRRGDWKADRYGLDQPIELYDLATDLGEQHNVAAKHPDLVAQMAAIMKQEHTPAPWFPLRAADAHSRDGGMN